MTTSYSTEVALIELAESLDREARLLTEAAAVLKVLRESQQHQAEIKAAKERARGWLEGIK